MAKRKKSPPPQVAKLEDFWAPPMYVTDKVVDRFARHVRLGKSYNLHFGSGKYVIDGRACTTGADYIARIAAEVLDTNRKFRREAIQDRVRVFADEAQRRSIERLLQRIVERVYELGQVTKKELYDDADDRGSTPQRDRETCAPGGA